MNDNETNYVLCSILSMIKEQVQYQHRLHGWLIAATETIEQDDVLRAKLREHPFYDQGPRPDEHITANMIRNIDALILKLKV